MKAFHLGAFEVMVVTDDRLSESGGGSGDAFTCFGVYACACFSAPPGFSEHRASIDGAAAFMDSNPRKAAVVGQREARGAV